MSALVEGFRVTTCEQCGTSYFPRRLICRKCGNDSWSEAVLREAVVEESTTIRHVTGDDRAAPRHLATVRAGGELHLIAGLDAPLSDGTPVLLYEKDGAPIARRRES
jgi:uncharacterized OB-fold protein